MTRLAPAVALAAVLLALAACGGGDKRTATTATRPPVTVTLARVYFVVDGKLQPVLRELRTTTAAKDEIADAALEGLAAGPSESERQLGLSSSVPSDFKSSGTTVAADGKVAISTDQELSRLALAQVVYTLSHLPPSTGPSGATVDEQRYTTADFEDETPAILVESPLPFQTVASPIHVRGTANTFEATFEYDLVEPEGRIVKTHFVTATSGSGTRGTFSFTVPYAVDRSGLGELVVYERSAEDGSRIHVVEIPIRLTR